MKLTSRRWIIVLASLLLIVGLVLGPGVAKEHMEKASPGENQPAEKVKTTNTSLKIASQLWFDGTSTVRDWACKKAPVKGSIEVPPAVRDAQSRDELREALVATPDTAIQTAMEFPVQEIRCEKGERMNNHLRNALQAEKYPNITFALQSVRVRDAGDTGGEGFAATAGGELTIKGTTKRISVPIRVRRSGQGTIHVSGKKKLDMTKYGVEPPTIMWTITVYDNITLHTDFLLRPNTS